MIRGDNGTQIVFRKSVLSGVEFYALSSGQRVCYRVQDGWLGKEAVEVRPLLLEKAAENGCNQGREARANTEDHQTRSVNEKEKGEQAGFSGGTNKKPRIWVHSGGGRGRTLL